MNPATLLAEITTHFPGMPPALPAAPNLAALSSEEFRHYIPACMAVALQAPASAISAEVVLALKLPIELNAATVAAGLRLHTEAPPGIEPRRPASTPAHADECRRSSIHCPRYLVQPGAGGYHLPFPGLPAR
jgi:hypothetical protein